MNNQIVNQSGDPSATQEAVDQPSTTTPTTTDMVTTTTVDPYPDQVSRANDRKSSDPANANFDPSLLAAGTAKQDFVDEGQITPTVYYNAIINDDKACTGDVRVVLHGLKGEELTKVCPRTLEICGLQGSCTLIQGAGQKSYNVINQFKGVDHFVELDVEECPFGLGVRSICLDPFYTVAADLKFYRPGDVIFIPALVGHELINGKTHSGFFIVRDQGRGIIGKGRFDFFSGFYSWRDPKNPFARIKLPDSKTKLQYYKVTGDSAKLVLSQRSFPGLPTIKKPTK